MAHATTEPAAEPVLDLAGPGAPPRRNGELAFDEPWQGRLFGLTMALCQRGLIDFERFRQHLITEIAHWEAENPDGAGYTYWDRWQAALEQLLDQSGRLDAPTLTARASALSTRPPGHDHGHDHEH